MANIKAWLGNLFDVRAGEWRRLTLLYTFAFLLNTTVVWGQAASYALFLEKSGASNLPYMFIADAILTALAILIYGAFVDRIANTRLMNIICFAGSLLVLSLAISVHLDVWIAYPVLFLLERVWRALISIHSWTYIADFYDARMAKRHFPLIGSGSRTSGILAGLLIIPIVMFLNVENLVVAWSVVLFVSGVTAWGIPRLVQPATSAHTPDQQKTNILKNYQEGFQSIRNSPFLRLMAVAALVSTLVIYFLEFEAQSFLESYFHASANDLSMFYGMLETIANLLTLPIQMFLLSRIITRFGVGNANLIFPGLTALAYGMLAAIPSLVTASFARITHTSLRSAFRTPIDGLLYNAVPPNLRGRARAFINGLLIPMGALLAGSILVLIGQQWIPASVLVIPGLLVALFYVYLGIRLRSRYTQSLLNLLQNDEMSIFRASRGELEPIAPAALDLLQTRLQESDSDETTIVLAEILYDVQGVQAIPLLHQIAVNRSGEVRANILLMLKEEALFHPLLRSLCLAGMEDPDHNVRQAAVEALTHTPEQSQTYEPALLEALWRLLDDPDDTIQANILPILIRSNQPAYQEPASARLNEWLDSTNDFYRMRGLHVLAKIGDERLAGTLHKYRDDPSPAVRCEIVALIGDLIGQATKENVRQQGLAIIQTYQQDADETVRLTVVETLARITNLDVTSNLLHALADESFRVRRLACDGMLGRTHARSRNAQQLEETLTSTDVYLVESATFILTRSGNSRTRRVLLQLIEQLVTDAYTLHGHCAAIQSWQSQAAQMLATALAEQIDLVIARIFWLLGAFAAEEDIDALYRSLQSKERSERANAIEALESQTTPVLARLIAPLLNGETPTEALLEHTRASQQQTTPTAWQVIHFLWPHFSYNGTTPPPLSNTLVRLYQHDWLQALTIHTVTTELAARHELAHPAFARAVEQTIQDEQIDSLLTDERSGGKENSPMLTLIEKVIFLKHVSFFQRMTTEQLRVLAGISEEVSFAADEQIISEGGQSMTLYVIVSGRAAVQRVTNKRRRSIARLAVLGPKEYFAEMSLFDDEPHSADVVALEDIQLLLVRRDPLIMLIKRQPELGLELLRVLSQRLRQSNAQLSEKTQAKPKELLDVYDKLWGE